MFTSFVCTLACKLEVGNALFIAGKTTDSARSFTINLRCNKEKDSDIDLQFKVLFRRNIVVRNAKVGGRWGSEELNEILESPECEALAPGDFFIVCIFVGESFFRISINHRQFCVFKYRGLLSQVNVLEIAGHLQIITQVDHRTIFPAPWPVKQISDPRKAFSNDIPILFSPGHVVIISAAVSNNVRGQFIIQFTELDTGREGLHFNPRFDAEVVVRNVRKACKDDILEYGAEERDGGFPFKFDRLFCLAIAFTEKEFRFAVDGTYFCSFPYYTSNLLQVLNGFKIITCNGMQVQVYSVDHMKLFSADCENFEKFSTYGYEMLRD